jgi:hypothetical protein
LSSAHRPLSCLPARPRGDRARASAFTLGDRDAGLG